MNMSPGGCKHHSCVVIITCKAYLTTHILYLAFKLHVELYLCRYVSLQYQNPVLYRDYRIKPKKNKEVSSILSSYYVCYQVP